MVNENGEVFEKLETPDNIPFYDPATKSLRTAKINQVDNKVNKVLTEREKYEEAEDVYRLAIKADPTHSAALNNLAYILHFIRNSYDEAEVRPGSSRASSFPLPSFSCRASLWLLILILLV